MAIPSAVCTVADGAAAAVSAASSAVQVTPGNQITVALNSTAGVQQWQLRTRFSDNAGLAGLFALQTAGFSFTFAAPLSPFRLQMDSSVTDSFNNYTSLVVIQGGVPILMSPHRARNIITANVSALTNYTVTTSTLNDNVSGGNLQGDVVLLVAQSTASQNGLYVCGAVTSSACALTRAPDWTTGTVLPAGQVVEVTEGTVMQGTRWRVTTAGNVTVDTNSVNLYPATVCQQVTLVAGTVTITNVPLLNSTRFTMNVSRITPTGTSSTITYQPASVTVGVLGTVTMSCIATVAAGTINVADSSVVNVAISQF